MRTWLFTRESKISLDQSIAVHKDLFIVLVFSPCALKLKKPFKPHNWESSCTDLFCTNFAVASFKQT